MEERKELEDLGLGELYQRACTALSLQPDKDLTDALNSDDPKLGLIKVILGSSTLESEHTMAVVSCENTIHGNMGLIVEPQSAFGVELVAGLKAEPDENEKIAFHSMFQHATTFPPRIQVWKWLQLIACIGLRGVGAQAYIDRAQEELRQTLEQLQAQAAERQASRRAQRFGPGTELEPVVKQKLETPDKALSPEESRKCLVSCIAYGKVQADRASARNVVVVVGNTGAGKSSFINLLHGCTFELDAEDRMVVQPSSSVRELMKIGHTNKSETFAPQVDACAFGENYAFADCPGFLDNRGFEINIANAVNVKQALVAAASAVVIVIINYHSLLADRGKGVKDLFHILSDLFGTIDSVRKHAKSLLLAISQAPAVHPETGRVITLDGLKRKLLDPSGLDEMAKDLLSAIGDANVITYHLLERGGASWSKRDALVAHIRGLVPITEPNSLFKSAINDADKESLRHLVNELAKELQVMISASDYDRAADVVSDILELKEVEHGFVTTVVDEAISAVIHERLVSVTSVVEKGSAPNLEDGEYAEHAPAPDEKRIDNARTQLRKMSLLLAAFAGVPEVREKLKASLIEATCHFESIVKAAAEAQGRAEVELCLQEVLRTVGGNVVKEVLALPKAAARMQERHREERVLLEDAHDAALRAVSDGTLLDLADAAKEQHAIRLQEAAYRATAAKEMWHVHIRRADTKLVEHDQSLLAENGAVFWSKVGWTSERLCTEADSTLVSWAGKKLSTAEFDVMATVLRQLEGPPSLRMLSLSTNLIDDECLTMLSDATAFGALANLQKLFLNNNKITDVGMAELCSALAAGRLAKLSFLDMNSNLIGDPSMIALSHAISNGALADLGTLYLHCNKIGDAGSKTFVKSVASSSGLAKLEKLWLYNNMVGDSGMKALSDWIMQGGLPSLKCLQLEGNLASNCYEIQKSLLQTVRGRIP
eukprot:TRINITY_DN75379_c0_g1_i1.p1 TRINITY_DN75379_c0_g1~~TRINITY_DN75379_c0_g1_i1.p1  ORF type:complete len:943 (+),score=139.06 TRINITY_DN75379_c0_g1_i1:95-2923(+)